MKLYKGNIITCGRKSIYSLYDANIASMEGVESDYNQDDAAGFIQLNGLRLRARHAAQGAGRPKIKVKAKATKKKTSKKKKW